MERLKTLQSLVDAVLVWSWDGTHAVLDTQKSSTKSLQFINYTYSSKSFKFALGKGIVGQCMSSSLFTIIHVDMNKTTVEEFYRLKEALQYSVRTCTFFKIRDDTVVELVNINPVAMQDPNKIITTISRYLQNVDVETNRVDPYFISRVAEEIHDDHSENSSIDTSVLNELATPKDSGIFHEIDAKLRMIFDIHKYTTSDPGSSR